jgi:hypothetical protein
MKKLIALSALLFASLANAGGWEYNEQEDKMTSKKASYATVGSNNSLSLGFPYKGHNPGELRVRQHPKFGLDVYVSVAKGQILCRSYEDCTIMVRFDDDQPKAWRAVGPADHSSDVIFLRNEAAFIARAKTAKKILISIPFFQNGNQVLEFYPAQPLVWGTKKK